MTFRRLPILILLALLMVSVVPLAAQEVEDTEILGYTISAPVDGMRTVEHFMGETEIPADPQRIITLHDQGLTMVALELGVRPIGSHGRTSEDGTNFFRLGPGYLGEGIEHVGTFGAVNLERILELEPDLIIGRNFEEEIYDDLTSIAPTILVPSEIHFYPIPFSEYVATLLNRTERHDELVAQYEGTIERIRQLVPNYEEVYATALIMSGGEGEIFVRGFGMNIDTVLEDVGFNRREALQDIPFESATSLSLEVANTVDADFIFNHYWDWTIGESASVENGPIWQSLWAVQNGQYITTYGLSTYGSAMYHLNNAAEMVLTHIGERDFITREGGWE
ncbi:MAG: ABC transporter substrate-binding protein [Chloroflexota bacterium]